MLLKEDLPDELLQVLSECPTLDSRVSLTFVVGTVILQPGKQRVVSKQSWAPNPWLVFESIEDFVDRELQ